MKLNRFLLTSLRLKSRKRTDENKRKVSDDSSPYYRAYSYRKESGKQKQLSTNKKGENSYADLV